MGTEETGIQFVSFQDNQIKLCTIILCPYHRSILHFMAHRHAKTGPESREGETLEASGCPDLAKQTKREWPTFEKVFDGPLAETPTHEVCRVHP